jgi:hypothetical protein
MSNAQIKRLTLWVSLIGSVAWAIAMIRQAEN